MLVMANKKRTPNSEVTNDKQESEERIANEDLEKSSSLNTGKTKDKIKNSELWKNLFRLKESILVSDASEKEKLQQEYLKARSELFMRYRRLSEMACAKYCGTKMPYRSILDRDDILSLSDRGLLRAIDGWNPSLGAFTSRAYTCIFGTIIDGLRSMQDFPRIVSIIRRHIQPMIEELSHAKGKLARLEDIQEFDPDLCISGIHISEVIKNPLIMANVYNQETGTSEDDNCFSTGNNKANSNIEEVHSRRNSCQPYDRMQKMDTMNKISRILSGDSRESACIHLYYFFGMNSVQIAKVINLSATSVSLKIKSGLAKIRKEARNNPDFAEELMNLKRKD
jgi:RNA polymerase sigma factor (sigma-70 family)